MRKTLLTVLVASLMLFTIFAACTTVSADSIYNIWGRFTINGRPAPGFVITASTDQCYPEPKKGFSGPIFGFYFIIGIPSGKKDIVTISIPGLLVENENGDLEPYRVRLDSNSLKQNTRLLYNYNIGVVSSNYEVHGLPNLRNLLN